VQSAAGWTLVGLAAFYTVGGLWLMAEGWRDLRLPGRAALIYMIGGPSPYPASYPSWIAWTPPSRWDVAKNLLGKLFSVTWFGFGLLALIPGTVALVLAFPVRLGRRWAALAGMALVGASELLLLLLAAAAYGLALMALVPLEASRSDPKSHLWYVLPAVLATLAAGLGVDELGFLRWIAREGPGDTPAKRFTRETTGAVSLSGGVTAEPPRSLVLTYFGRKQSTLRVQRVAAWCMVAFAAAYLVALIGVVGWGLLAYANWPSDYGGYPLIVVLEKVFGDTLWVPAALPLPLGIGMFAASFGVRRGRLASAVVGIPLAAVTAVFGLGVAVMFLPHAIAHAFSLYGFRPVWMGIPYAVVGLLGAAAALAAVDLVSYLKWIRRRPEDEMGPKRFLPAKGRAG
jgi:hypothetical protein